jgi:hypothetical protein
VLISKIPARHEALRTSHYGLLHTAKMQTPQRVITVLGTAAFSNVETVRYC